MSRILISAFLIILIACKSNKIKLLEEQHAPIKMKLKQTFLVGPDNKDFYYRNENSLQLANIYISEEKYDSALLYLKLSETTYKPIDFGCSTGSYEKRYLLEYNYAQCYAGMKNIDTAISILTPNMFIKQKDIFIDSTKFEEINNFYLKLLFKKYTKAQLKKEINKGLNNLVYTKTSTSADWVSISCYFSFMKTKIYLLDSDIVEDSWDDYSLKFLSKEDLLKYAKETNTFKKLNH